MQDPVNCTFEIQSTIAMFSHEFWFIEKEEANASNIFCAGEIKVTV